MHRTPSPRRRLLSSLACIGLLVAACGGDDDSSSDSGGDNGATSDDSASVPPGSQLLSSAGDAPAARGAGLVEPPGPADRELLDGFGEVAIAITNPDGSVKGWCVLLAEQRQRGLMEVTDLAGYAGMLFVWADDSSSSFYMRNTPTPLSIAWIDAVGRIVSTDDMEPCGDIPTCPLYTPEGSYRFALEVPKGHAARPGAGRARGADLGLVEGATLKVGGDCATT